MKAMCSLSARLLATAASVFLLGAMAWAQSNNMAKPDPVDRTFMEKAAQANMAEVQLGQLAEQNAQSQEVKDFGKRMVIDHTEADNQLKQLAEKQNVTLPTNLSAKDRATKNRLEKLHGEAFDRTYMHDMVRDHEHDVAEFRRDEKTIRDTQLKDWVINTLPTLDSHLEEAKKVAGTVGVNMVAAKSHKPGATNDPQSSTTQ
jgi:putative membrane protein